MDEIVIFGTGKISDVVSQCIEDFDLFDIAGYTCEAEYNDRQSFRSKKVVDFEEVTKYYPPKGYMMFVAVGYHDLNKVRARIIEKAKILNYKIVSIVHPDSGIFSDLVYGENCFIMNQVNIQPGVKLGNNVFVWSGALIGHHAKIGDNCWITSGANISGSVIIGESCFLAVNTTIINNIRIGKSCFLGANTLIGKDLRDESVAIEPYTPVNRFNSTQFLKFTKLN